MVVVGNLDEETAANKFDTMKPFSYTTVDRVYGSQTGRVMAMSYEEAIRVVYQQMSAAAYQTGSFISVTVTAL